MSINRYILKWGGVAGALAAIGSVVYVGWTAADSLAVRPVFKWELAQLVAQVTQDEKITLTLQLQEMEARWAHGGLSEGDRQQMCHIVDLLGWDRNLVDGCH